MGISPLAFTDEKQENGLINTMVAEAKSAMIEDRAEAIIGYGGYRVIHKLREELPIPIINPTQASVLVAEMLVRSSLSQSKIAFARPEILDQE